MATTDSEPLSSRPPMQESQTLSKHGALAMLKAGREGTAPANPPAINSVSDAARTLALSKRSAPQAPAQDKPASSQRTAPAQAQEKPEEEAEDNADQAAPEGQDAEEEQAEGAEVEATDDDGQEPTIDIDGEKLTAQEIRDSYLRRDDYTRKTQDLAEERRVLGQTLGAITQNSQRLEQLVGLLEQAVGQEPDWGNLAMTMEPRNYLAYKENWNAQKAALNNVQAERIKSFNTSILQAKGAMIDEAARSFRPEWQDRTKMQEGTTKLAEFALSMGITQDELQMLHRTPMLRILDMAYENHALKASQRITDKRVKGKPKPTRPGAQRTPISSATAQLESERQLWESNKRPDTKASMRWISAKRAYESATGKRA